jgi:hypothetical protein
MLTAFRPFDASPMQQTVCVEGVVNTPSTARIELKAHLFASGRNIGSNLRLLLWG